MLKRVFFFFFFLIKIIIKDNSFTNKRKLRLKDPGYDNAKLFRAPFSTQNLYQPYLQYDVVFQL